jgi:hypothetical protein
MVIGRRGLPGGVKVGRQTVASLGTSRQDDMARYHRGSPLPTGDSALASGLETPLETALRATHSRTGSDLQLLRNRTRFNDVRSAVAVLRQRWAGRTNGTRGRLVRGFGLGIRRQGSRFLAAHRQRSKRRLRIAEEGGCRGCQHWAERLSKRGAQRSGELEGDSPSRVRSRPLLEPLASSCQRHSSSTHADHGRPS